MQSESGPLMGTCVSYVNWQSQEPNNQQNLMQIWKLIEIIELMVDGMI